MKSVAFMAAVIFASGCFKPDEASSEAINRLVGYWEVVHITDYDYTYIPVDAVETDKSDVYSFDSDISANDGNREYGVVRFTDSYVSMIAHDDPDEVETLNIPFSYTYDDSRLYGTFFSDTETNLRYTTVEKLTDTELHLFQDERYMCSEYSERWAHDTRLIILRKIH